MRDLSPRDSAWRGGIIATMVYREERRSILSLCFDEESVDELDRGHRRTCGRGEVDYC